MRVLSRSARYQPPHAVPECRGAVNLACAVLAALSTILLPQDALAGCTRRWVEMTVNRTGSGGDGCQGTTAIPVSCDGTPMPGATARVVSHNNMGSWPCNSPAMGPGQNDCDDCPRATTTTTAPPSRTLDPGRYRTTSTLRTTLPTIPNRPVCGNGVQEGNEGCDRIPLAWQYGDDPRSCCTRLCKPGDYFVSRVAPQAPCFEDWGDRCLSPALSDVLSVLEPRVAEAAFNRPAYCDVRGCCVERRLRPVPRVPPNARTYTGHGNRTLIADSEVGQAEAAVAPLTGARVVSAIDVKIKRPGDAKYGELTADEMLQTGDELLVRAGSWLEVERCGQRSRTPDNGMDKSAAKNGSWLVMVVGGSDPAAAESTPLVPSGKP